ncbi:MAG: DnaA regulatory inactivator Hda [Methylococcales bacterium]|nr:DnaA regulatory inactivator Hda [Methylococcales bacterium]
MAKQLILDFGAHNDKTFDNFVPGSNQELIAQLQVKNSKNTPAVFFSGPNGAGKSHLLSAACAEANYAAAYIPMADAETLSTSILEGLDALALVCIDDIHLIAGDVEWEEAVFNLYNRSKDAQQRLYISCQQPVAETAFRLADLSSRLSWGLNYQINPLTDEEKIIALTQHANARSLDIPSDVSRYLLTHYSREMPALLSLLDKLDTASLAEKRKLTIPFVKQLL